MNELGKFALLEIRKMIWLSYTANLCKVLDVACKECYFMQLIQFHEKISLEEWS